MYLCIYVSFLKKRKKERLISSCFSVQYHCEEGYILAGNRTNHCKLDGRWSTDTPKCVHGMSSRNISSVSPVVERVCFRRRGGYAGL